MKTSKSKSPLLGMVAAITGVLLGSCAHHTEESGRKTEYNSATGRFETFDYATVGVSFSKMEERRSAVSEKDFKKARD